MNEWELSYSVFCLVYCYYYLLHLDISASRNMEVKFLYSWNLGRAKIPCMGVLGSLPIILNWYNNKYKSRAKCKTVENTQENKSSYTKPLCIFLITTTDAVNALLPNKRMFFLLDMIRQDVTRIKSNHYNILFFFVVVCSMFKSLTLVVYLQMRSRKLIEGWPCSIIQTR